MTNTPQKRTIKCPHCGWERAIEIEALADASMTIVVQGAKETLKQISQKLKEALDPLAKANDWYDMPACSNCRKAYLYNARTGETRK